MNDPANRLRDVLGGYGRLAVAVSGGVDSLTLAFCAARWVPDILAIHAVSPAVPAEATERVRRYAETNGWPLKVVSSGEFKDPNYRANPHNRCYFCKSNLYTTMTELFDGPVASGTNTDDLGDYRPGLVAAKENAVVHPFVEAGIGKDDLRAIARLFDLQDIAELPAQPCLSSRVESGIRLEAADLVVDEIVRTAHIAWPAGADPAMLADQAAELSEVGVDQIIFSMRGPYPANEVEPLGVALARL